MAPIEQRHAAQDDVMNWSASAEYAERFGRTHTPMAHPAPTALPVHLANAMAPRRNLVAEFSALPVDALLAEAEDLLVSLRDMPRASAVVIALVRKLKAQKPALDSAIWLDLGAAS